MKLSEVTYPRDTKSRVQSLLVQEANLTSSTSPRNPKSRSSKPRPIVRRTVLLAAAAAMVTATFVAADALNLLGSSPATAEAVEVLNETAQKTIQFSDPALLPGQFLRIETTAASLDVGDGPTGRLYWLESQDRQLYIPADKSAPRIMNFEPIRPLSYFGYADEASVLALESRTPHGRTEYGGVWQIDPISPEDELAALPLEPKQLLDFIRNQDGAEDADDAWVFSWISGELLSNEIPAPQRATLYQTITLIPGVTLVDHQAVLDGRTGIAIGLVNPDSKNRFEIIVDPGTGQFIGERIVDLDGNHAIPAGSVITWTAIKTTVVDSAPVADN